MGDVRQGWDELARLLAVREMALSGCAEVDAALGTVEAPTLVVMGAADPDFPDPAAEADAIADRLDASVLLVPDAGHYPHIERPDVVGPAISDHVHRTRPCHPAV